MTSGNAASLARRFRADGFVVLPDAVGPEWCAAVRAACMAHYAPLLDTPPGRDPINGVRPEWEEYATDVLPWVPPPSDAASPFDDVVALPLLREATAACVGDGFSEVSPLAMLTPPAGKGQAWHQNGAYDFRSLQPVPRTDPRVFPVRSGGA